MKPTKAKLPESPMPQPAVRVFVPNTEKRIEIIGGAVRRGGYARNIKGM